MKSIILLSALNLSVFGGLRGMRDDHDHTHDSHDHSGHQHTSDIQDCECITGYTTENLAENCDNAPIVQLQEYMMENNCDSVCHLHGDEQEYEGTTEADFRCFQAYTLLLQYHDYCPSGAINESLLHDYLEVCPDCLQKHYQYENTPECDGGLNCTDTTAQETEIQFVSQNCVDTCEKSECAESWQVVEGYHRMCAHDELSEEFDTLYDSLAFAETECGEDIHCNVPWEEDYSADCSSELNEDWTAYVTQYGELDLDKHILSGTARMITACAFVVSFAAVFFV